MRVDSEMREKKATDQRKHGLLGRWHSKSWKQHQLHRLWCPLFLPLQKCLILSFCGAALGPQEEVQRNCPCGTEGTQAHCIPGGTSGKEPICRCRRHKRLGPGPWCGGQEWHWTGNPLQYSCPQTPMDRGTWQATVHSITQSQTQLKRRKLMISPPQVLWVSISSPAMWG